MDGALGELRTTLVLVDPISSARCLAREASSRGFTSVAICQSAGTHDDDDFSFSFTHHSLAETVDVLQRRVVDGALAILSGSDDGVPLAEALSAELGIPIFTPALSGTRRAAKHEQQRAVEAAGLRACRGAAGNHWTLEMEAVCGESLPVVVKLAEGTGSEGTKLCETAAAARTHVEWLLAHCVQDAEVLVQEYLKGDEYVVDTVSRDGEHKVVAIWKYMKRPCNGVANCWFGQRLLPIDAEPHLPQFEAYIYGVLDAIGITNGAVHSEVKFDGSTPSKAKRGPVLIECNCRLHGIEGSWAPIVERCLGYSQVSALLDAYYEPTAFAALPPHPATEAQATAFGAQIGVRSMVEGEITRVNQARVEEIRSVASYVSENVAWSGLQPGCRIAKTVDVVTLCGQISLVHASQAQLEADMARVQEVIDAGLFEVEVAPLAFLGWRRLAMGLAIGAAVVAVAAASFGV